MTDRLIKIKEEIKEIKGELIANHYNTDNYKFKLKAIVTLMDFINLTISLFEE